MSAEDRMVVRMRPRVRVGCYDWEKEMPREVSVEMDFAFDCREAGRSDDLSKGFNYEPLGKRVLEFCERPEGFDLVEAVAEGVARILVVELGVSSVRVAVTKREALPAMDGVTVEIRRGAGDF